MFSWLSSLILASVPLAHTFSRMGSFPANVTQHASSRPRNADKPMIHTPDRDITKKRPPIVERKLVSSSGRKTLFPEQDARV